MQLPALTREQVRRVDHVAMDQYAIPGVVLMENAGRGAAEIIHDLDPESTVTLLCGPGNNGGDGYVIARHLQLMGHGVRIVAMTSIDRLGGDALINATVADKAGLDIRVATTTDVARQACGDATVLVDCLLGTGAQGDLRKPYAEVVSLANAAEAVRVAIDLPSGLDCDSGVAGDPTFQADHTITFVSRKVGFDRADGPRCVGQVHEVGIGVPLGLLESMFG